MTSEMDKLRYVREEDDLDTHRTRWQMLVNAVAGAWNRGLVPGNDDEAVAWAIREIKSRSALSDTARQETGENPYGPADFLHGWNGGNESGAAEMRERAAQCAAAVVKSAIMDCCVNINQVGDVVANHIRALPIDAAQEGE